MSTGLALLAVGSIGLVAEYAWREVAGHLTAGMLALYVALAPVMMAGVYMCTAPFAWPALMRLPLAVVVGYFAWKAVYAATAVVWGVLAGSGR